MSWIVSEDASDSESSAVFSPVLAFFCETVLGATIFLVKRATKQ